MPPVEGTPIPTAARLTNGLILTWSNPLRGFILQETRHDSAITKDNSWLAIKITIGVGEVVPASL
jgi:hypothetical protein